MGSDGENPDREVVDGLLAAYSRGLFPMASPGGGVSWYDPDPRGVFGLGAGGLRVSRSLRRRVVSGRFEVTCDRDFSGVIRACAEPRGAYGGEDETWIDGRIVGAYAAMHRAGCAHSVEAWLDGELVGGLYGVHLNGLFAGESMFTRPGVGGTDASKVCLVHLWHHLRAIGAVVLDTQFWTPHLGTLGCVEVRRSAYRALLGRAMGVEAAWGAFDPGRAVSAVGARGGAGASDRPMD